MGTNYYHRYNHCDCCGRYDERHICKSMVTFRGYRPDSDWPDDFTGPLLTSWRQWKAELLAGGSVWNEYGDALDTAEFIAAVESTRPDSRRRQYDRVQENAYRHPGRPTDQDWLDGDGFSFYGGEFS